MNNIFMSGVAYKYICFSRNDFRTHSASQHIPLGQLTAPNPLSLLYIKGKCTMFFAGLAAYSYIQYVYRIDN